MTDPWPITLAGILMDDEPDADGIRWRVSSVDGWDAPAVRLDEGERTGQHGGFGSAPLWAARTLTVSGRAHCPDIATAFRGRDIVAAHLSCMSPAALVVHESVPKSLTVVCGGTPRSSSPIDAPPYRVTWQVTLTARDPFKRALTPVTTPLPAGQSVFVPSPGTAAADLLVTVTTAGTVSLGVGDVMLRTLALPVGAVIDTATSTIRTETGADLFTRKDPRTQFPQLPAGGGLLKSLGTAGLSIQHFDTYA